MKQEIIKLKDRMLEAIQRKDAATFVSLFSKKSVMYLLNPPFRFKTGANSHGETGIEEWFNSFDGPIELSYEELEAIVDNDVAFCHSLEHLMGKRVDGTFTDVWYRETLGFQKIDGEWKISHQHQSFPTYMDGSGKAADDLTPDTSYYFRSQIV